jgi:polyphosphate kinase
LSDNIRVRSIVGRWLEHSRIFYFAAGSGDIGAVAINDAAAGRAENAGPTGRNGAGDDNGATGEGTVAGDGRPADDGEGVGRPDGGLYLVGSADMMERNLDRRVEAVVPVEAPELRARLQEILELDLADDTRAWELDPDDSWHKVTTRVGVHAQHALQELAVRRSRRRREPSVMHRAPPE